MKWLSKTFDGVKSRFGVVPLAAAILFVAWLLYPSAAPKHEGKKEIVLWMPLDPMLFDPVKPLLDEFEARHPEYHVHLGTSTTRDESSDPTRFLLGVAGGVPPDVMFFDRFAIVEWASRGAFQDLNPYIQRDSAQPDGIHPEDYFEPAWKETQWQGGTFAIPAVIDTRALYYLEAPLQRSGFIYKDGDPEVLQGKALAGDARPPKSWEEVSEKRAHLTGVVGPDGRVAQLSFPISPGINEGKNKEESVDLSALNVQTNDVVALIRNGRTFRGRIAGVSAQFLNIDLELEQPRGQQSIPANFVGECEIKIYSQNDYVSRLTRIDADTGQLTAAAFLPIYGNSWLYLFAWQNGGEIMNPAGDQVLLNSPQIIAALQWLQDVYDEMGGFEIANVFQTGATQGGIDPSLTGQLAMRIDGDQFLNIGILANNPQLAFAVAPAPIPAAQLKAGAKPIGWGGGFAYAIPSTARNKEGAWELLKWLSSADANRMLVEAQASMMRGKGQPLLPAMNANAKNLAMIDAEFVRDNPAIPSRVKAAAQVFRELLPTSRYRPVTPVGQKLWSEQVRAMEAALNHARTPYDALTYAARRGQNALDEIRHPPNGPRVNWTILIILYLGLIIGGTLALIAYQSWSGRLHGDGGKQWWEGYIAAAPWLFGFVVFGAGPILFSTIISFCSYDVLSPAKFTGFSNYVELLGAHQDNVLGGKVWNDPIFWKSLGNTLFMVISVPLSIAVGLGIAMLLNVEVRGSHIYRTLFYLPAIVPAVAGFMLWMWMLDPNSGILNIGLRSIGISNPPNWLQNAVWAKPSLIIMLLWAAGGSMVVWIAGLKDIPDSLYEAAQIDGASPWQRFVHITLPMLSPYILFNTIMGLIGVFQIFEAAFVMTNGGPADATLFYVYRLFNEAFRYLRMGPASAMAWLLFLFVLAITLLQLWLSKKWVHYRG